MDDAVKPTGVSLLDERMGGFLVGDNVILEVEVGTPPRSFLLDLMRAALGRGERVVYVSFDRSPATIVSSLAPLPKGDLIVLDAFTEGKGRGEPVFRSFYAAREPREREVVRVDHPQRPLAFHEDFDLAAASGQGTFIVVDSLTGMQELWGSEERARAFYTHTCPRLFDTRAIAVWVLDRAVHSDEFRAGIGHVAQVVIRLSADGPKVRVVRALGRKVASEDTVYVDTGDSIRAP